MNSVWNCGYFCSHTPVSLQWTKRYTHAVFKYTVQKPIPACRNKVSVGDRLSYHLVFPPFGWELCVCDESTNVILVEKKSQFLIPVNLVWILALPCTVDLGWIALFLQSLISSGSNMNPNRTNLRVVLQGLNLVSVFKVISSKSGT